MSEYTSCDPAGAPYWVEECSVLDGTHSGTYLIDDYPVATFRKRTNEAVLAQLFVMDETDRNAILVDVEGRNGPFDTAEGAKAQLEMVARPSFGSYR